MLLRHNSVSVFACMSKVCAPPPAGKGGSLPSKGGSVPSPSEGQSFIADVSSERVFGTSRSLDITLVKSMDAKIKANKTVSAHMAKDSEFSSWVEKNKNTVAAELHGMNAILGSFGAKVPRFGETLAEYVVKDSNRSNARLIATVGELAIGMRIMLNDPSLTDSEAIAHIVSRVMIDGWAASSGGLVSGSSQIMAAKVHSVSSASFRESDHGGGKAAMDALRSGAQSRFLHEVYVRSEYQATQAWFKERGIKDVTVFRGVRYVDNGSERFGEGETVKLNSNPLSSWSTHPEVAKGFAMFGATRSNKRNSVVLAMKVPASAIQSTPWTGRGCLDEFEIVLIGKPASALVIADETTGW